jgi:hypothetical protein
LGHAAPSQFLPDQLVAGLHGFVADVQKFSYLAGAPGKYFLEIV